MEPCCYVCFLKESGYLTSFDRNFIEFGHPKSHPCLILGDGVSNVLSLQDQASKLAKSGFRVFLMEYPGIGHRFFEFFSEEKIFSSILELSNELMGKKMTIVGYGMGGYVAMNFAIKYHDVVDNCIAVSLAIPSLSLKSFVYDYFSRRSSWSWIQSWYRIGYSDCDVKDEEWLKVKRCGMTLQKWDDFVQLVHTKDSAYYYDHLQSPLCSFQSLFISAERSELIEKYADPHVVIEGANHYSIVMENYWAKVVETIGIFVKNPEALAIEKNENN